MDVDLRDLELLDALGRHETLTAAAQHLFVSQPALSQRLIRLESRLDTQLFERRGRRLVPNAAGHRMLQAARATLGELRAAVWDVREIRDGGRRPVRLITQCATNYAWLPEILHEFRQRMPGAEVRIESLPDDDLSAALLDDRIDVAIVSKLDRQLDHVRLQRLFDDELLAVVAATHPWAGRRWVDAEDFADVHLVLYESYDQRRIPAVPLPIPPSARPGRLTTIPIVTDLLIEMVTGGDVVTVLPSWIAAPYLATHDIATVQVGSSPQARTWYCATRHGPRPEPVDVFADLLVDHFDKTTPLPARADTLRRAPVAATHA